MKAPPLASDAILRYVAAHQPVDTVAIAAAFQVRRKHAFARLRELGQEGLIERVGRVSSGCNGRGVMVWCMPGAAPAAPQDDDDAQDERDTAPMRQTWLAVGAWQSANGRPVARWFDGLVR